MDVNLIPREVIESVISELRKSSKNTKLINYKHCGIAADLLNALGCKHPMTASTLAAITARNAALKVGGKKSHESTNSVLVLDRLVQEERRIKLEGKGLSASATGMPIVKGCAPPPSSKSSSDSDDEQAASSKTSGHSLASMCDPITPGTAVGDIHDASGGDLLALAMKIFGLEDPEDSNERFWTEATAVRYDFYCTGGVLTLPAVELLLKWASGDLDATAKFGVKQSPFPRIIYDVLKTYHEDEKFVFEASCFEKIETNENGIFVMRKIFVVTDTNVPNELASILINLRGLTPTGIETPRLFIGRLIAAIKSFETKRKQLNEPVSIVGILCAMARLRLLECVKGNESLDAYIRTALGDASIFSTDALGALASHSSVLTDTRNFAERKLSPAYNNIGNGVGTVGGATAVTGGRDLNRDFHDLYFDDATERGVTNMNKPNVEKLKIFAKQMKQYNRDVPTNDLPEIILAMLKMAQRYSGLDITSGERTYANLKRYIPAEFHNVIKRVVNSIIKREQKLNSHQQKNSSNKNTNGASGNGTANSAAIAAARAAAAARVAAAARSTAATTSHALLSSRLDAQDKTNMKMVALLSKLNAKLDEKCERAMVSSTEALDGIEGLSSSMASLEQLLDEDMM
jgi:hypothetical protein